MAAFSVIAVFRERCFLKKWTDGAVLFFLGVHNILIQSGLLRTFDFAFLWVRNGGVVLFLWKKTKEHVLQFDDRANGQDSGGVLSV